MKKKTITGFVLVAGMLLLTACSTSRGSQVRQTGSGDTIIVVGQPVSLASILRRVPGVLVDETGPYPRVFIRGGEPLFVLDGIRLGTDFSAAIHAVNINEVTAVEVLKSPSETFVYGRAGQNGVIVIHTDVFEVEPDR